jgi:Polyketide cyclase / dehydrase and lipid transport
VSWCAGISTVCAGLGEVARGYQEARLATEMTTHGQQVCALFELRVSDYLLTRSGGKHDVVVTMVEPGRSFELESTAMPMTRMAIRATITPIEGGTRLTQAFEPRGLLAPIVGPMMSGAILGTFAKVLTGLADKVEKS